MSKKEQGLLKGAIRRVFSRSELRRQVIESARLLNYDNPDRPRVKKWSTCAGCQTPTPQYLLQADHIEPVVPITKSLDDMTWDELVERIWCEPHLLQSLCLKCHKEKSKLENAQRRAFKKAKNI